MASSTRSRLIVFLVLLAALVAFRERQIRLHEPDLDDWPRRTDV